MTDIAHALASARILEDFPPDFIDRMVAVSKLRQFAPQEVVVRENEPATDFYIVTSGAFEVIVDANGSPTVVATLVPGDFFGEMALLREGTRTATIRSVGEGECSMLSKADFDAEMRKDPNAAAVLVVRLAQRINRHRKH